MNENATPTPHVRRFIRRDLLAIFVMCIALPLILVACEIIEVQQPSSAAQGETIEITVTIEQPVQDDTPHRGVVSVLVPEDWTFLSAAYSGDAGVGDMVMDEGWADSTEVVLPAPDGMKWIGMISDEAHAVPNPPGIYDVTIQLEVGQQTGDFGLGYFTTNDAFATADIEFGASEENTADSLMNVPITVTPATSADDPGLPGTYALAQNYPNPFHSATAIEFTMERPADVRLTVYDTSGREVTVFDLGARGVGTHVVDFGAEGLASGTYLYQLRADGNVVATRTMTLTK